ncbi:putative quinol monooxygenase [Nocardiopsis valliformis]|uniref:putative quinol monooxygenase n=1 Tax=Nocardiopsis valliformis TaxID=239974 RepID=UPI00034BD6FA|nr:antibiotic biosynthesis monooxygenase [Nocardiopsis valliformis]
MTFANVVTLETQPGRRDEVVAILSRRNPQLDETGCLLYEVGTSEERPDTVFVAELWESAQAHRAALELDSVRAAIAEARPLMTGRISSEKFDVAGSPLHD